MTEITEDVKIKWALRLAARGFRVHLLQPNSKIPPAGSEWKANATSDPAIIRQWFADDPSINYLVAPDEDHFVLDLDVKGERDGIKNLKDLQDLYGDLPDTMVVRTPSGGYHIYWQGSAPLSVGKASLGDGIDVRGNFNGKAGYVVGPGSTIDGKPYAVVADHPIVAAPDWLVDLCHQPAHEPLKRAEGVEIDNAIDVPRMRRRLADLVEQGDVAVEFCGGNNRTYNLFCEVLDYFSPELALELVGEIWNPACLPPWSVEELETICEHAVAHRQNEIGAKASVRAKVAFKDYKPEPEGANDDGGEDDGPENIFEKAAPTDIVDVSRDMLPSVIADFAEDSAERIGCTVSMVAIPALVMASGSLHDGYKLQPREYDTTWTEPARLWSMVIDKPSGAKTPAADAAMSIGRRIDAEWQAKRALDVARFEQQQEQYEVERKEFAKDPNLAKDPDAALLAPLPPTAPTERRLMANNFTVEGLRDVLADNPATICIYVNELAGTFGGLNEYKGGTGSDRQMLVELNDGGSKHIDRAGKRIFIPNWGASMFGTIQPGVLSANVKHRALADDGLFQRFMPFFGRTLGEGLDRVPNEQAIRRYEEVIRRLTSLPVPHGPPITCTLAPEARPLWEEISRFRWTSYQQEDDRNVEGYFGKWPKFFARLVMTFHAIECAAASDFTPDARLAPVVSAETVKRAHGLMMGFFYPQGLLVYGRMFTSLELEAQWVAEHILAHRLPTVKLRDLKHDHPAFKKSQELAFKAMGFLQERGWVGEPVEGARRGGGRSIQWPVDPSVHTIFAKRAAEARTWRGQLGFGLDAA